MKGTLAGAMAVLAALAAAAALLQLLRGALAVAAGGSEGEAASPFASGIVPPWGAVGSNCTPSGSASPAVTRY